MALVHAIRDNSVKLVDSKGNEIPLDVLTQVQTDALINMLNELKTTNEYFAEWSGFKIKEHTES